MSKSLERHETAEKLISDRIREEMLTKAENAQIVTNQKVLVLPRSQWPAYHLTPYPQPSAQLVGFLPAASLLPRNQISISQGNYQIDNNYINQATNQRKIDKNKKLFATFISPFNPFAPA